MIDFWEADMDDVVNSIPSGGVHSIKTIEIPLVP